MKLTEANIILVFVLLPYLPSPYRSNFVKEFSSSVRIHELINFNEFIHETFMKVREVLPAQKKNE